MKYKLLCRLDFKETDNGDYCFEIRDNLVDELNDVEVISIGNEGDMYLAEKVEE